MSSVRRGVERAKDEWNDVERRIRQRMRIYPQKLHSRTDSLSDQQREPAVRSAAAVAGGVSAAPGTTKPIISVHGRDIPEEEIDKPAA
ncbi:MAG: hypothetical protein ACRD4F_15415 [Candidatus Angelobacter sp.]